MERSSKRQIFRFFLKFLLITVIILFCDRGVGTILKHFFFRQESGISYRTTYSIDSTYADILVFGSSRANHNYVPEIFEKKFSATFYNTGKDGNFILYNYAIFKAITKRYNPELIIIDLNPVELVYNATEYERLSALLPYYKSHHEIRHIVDLRSPFERIKHISVIYPYNSLILQIAMGNLEFNKQRMPDIKGYVPLSKTMEYIKIDTVKVSTCIMDENIAHALNDIISTCQHKNIDLVFVSSPIWYVIQDSVCNTMLSDLCSAKGIRYLDLSNSPAFFNNPGYFADKSHLNDKGARVFSTIVTDKIMGTN